MYKYHEARLAGRSLFSFLSVLPVAGLERQFCCIQEQAAMSN